MDKQQYIEENFIKLDDLLKDTGLKQSEHAASIQFAIDEGHKYFRLYDGALHSYSDEFMKQSVEDLEEHHQSNLALYDLIRQEILFNPLKPESEKTKKKVKVIKWFASLAVGITATVFFYFIAHLARIADNPYVGWMVLATFISSILYCLITKGDE
ncbi:hypothetical protein H7S74_30280 [Priestia aryabhattai]|uniref:hypothetical protein n=1 Tax=Priestia aryabhattai TaxID=412384 RepID=UPI001EB1CA84|nr:hypothetical protein [Priestia aryabhattai]MBY0094929.1 hypothetical protein [Priestia aryabhattai]MBY0105583.1 hypothetical protein [Priestia aryabhattai]